MKKKNIILGINWEQNSSACLMIDGKIINATSEERFTRKKNDECYPKKSIDYLLNTNNIRHNQISYVCYISNFWSPSYSLIGHYSNFSVSDYIEEQKSVWYKRIYLKKKISILKVFRSKINYNQFPGRKFWLEYVKKLLKLEDHVSNKNIEKIGKEIRIKTAQLHLGINKNQIKFIDHSFGHIAYAYCSGPNYKKKSYVASLDAFGDFINYSLYFFDYKKKIIFKKITSGGNLIIARIYRYITLILGMKPNEHEYKVMGLAPYCKTQYSQELFKKFKKMQDVKGKFFKNLSMPKDSYFALKKLFEGFRFDSIAGALQMYTEYLLCKWFQNVITTKITKNLCIAGGIGMNVKANLLITNLKKINNLYIPPSPDDTSQSIGACYAFCLINNLDSFPIKNAYLGYKINNNNSKILIKSLSKKKYKVFNNKILDKAVELLSQNKILGICRGQAEFGARALGNRSIVCNPSKIENVIKVNETIKNRDFWMPFAASVLDKNINEYFFVKKSNNKNYKYMTNCLLTKKEIKDKIKCAIHPYDDTCRPQIVSKQDNLFYYNLIKKFGDKNNIYALMNTSFNLHGYPIVNNEKDALNVFLNSNMDALILENYLIKKI